MNEYKTILLNKINHRDARVAVIGRGYVGLPLAIALARAGFRTVGLDLDQAKVTALNAGTSYIQDVPSTEVAPLVAAGPAQRHRRLRGAGPM